MSHPSFPYYVCDVALVASGSSWLPELAIRPVLAPGRDTISSPLSTPSASALGEDCKIGSRFIGLPLFVPGVEFFLFFRCRVAKIMVVGMDE
jgi:hypothetical protein